MSRLLAHRDILHTLNRHVAFGGEADIKWQPGPAGTVANETLIGRA